MRWRWRWQRNRIDFDMVGLDEYLDEFNWRKQIEDDDLAKTPFVLLIIYLWFLLSATCWSCSDAVCFFSSSRFDFYSWHSTGRCTLNSTALLTAYFIRKFEWMNEWAKKTVLRRCGEIYAETNKIYFHAIQCHCIIFILNFVCFFVFSSICE